MLSRSLWLCFAVLCASPSVGCLFDSGGRGGGTTTGAGGSGAAGAGGGTDTSVTAGGSGTGSDPTCPQGCDDSEPCTEDSCEAGSCMHTPRPQGTLIENPDPADCKRSVCDENGHVVVAPDDTEVPNLEVTECHMPVCQNGSPVLVAASDASPCGVDVACQVGKCVNGNCSFTNAPNGDYPYPADGECAVVTCNNGLPGAPSGDVTLCNLTIENGGCRVPECGIIANGDFACYLIDGQNGSPCIKQNGNAGMCDNNGTCQ